MTLGDRRAELLERAYQRGYALRLRRRRQLAALATVVVVAGVVGGLTAFAGGDATKTLSVEATTTTTPSISRSCAPSIRTVPAASVPHDVAAWAGGAAVVGDGALWTIRSAISVPGSYQSHAWYVKFPWYTRPFDLPTITARRLDGPGTFHASVNQAVDARGTWVVSGLTFSTRGCWLVTSRYRGSTIQFHLQVGASPP